MASTLETKMSNLAGALRLLPIYVPQHPPIVMGQSTLWAQAIRAAHKRALQCSKRRATPATWADVQHIITNFDTEASLLILLAYCCCGRIGDVARLRKKDLLVSDAGIIVTFKLAKTSMKRGAYSVPASLPPNSIFADRLRTFIANARGFLFKKQTKDQTIPLLKTRDLTQHSIRRGAIHQLALSGMRGGDMIKFTGHNSLESLISYLDDGALDPAIIEGFQEGQVLFGGGGDDSFLPSTQEIMSAFPSLRDKAQAPLHVKEISHMNLKLLEDLPCVENTRVPPRGPPVGTGPGYVRQPCIVEVLPQRGPDISTSGQAHGDTGPS